MNTYTVTQIANAAKNAHEEIQKACELAYRLSELRTDLWNKFGGVRASDSVLREFKTTTPPES
jgi:hypothetical protein